MPFDFRAQKLVYGGDALGYHEGRPVLVPGALPGERLMVDEFRTAKGVVHARPVHLLEAAAERVDPPCSYYGRCGGCQYQHIRPEFQITAKREILRETLRRIGKIPWTSEIPIHAAHPLNYRNQARFKVQRRPDGRLDIGFFEAESHKLFPLDTCLILSPRLNSVLAELKKADWPESMTRCNEIELMADDRDERAKLTLHGRIGGRDAEALATQCLEHLPGVISVAIESGDLFRVVGKPYLDYCVGEFRYQVSHGSFFQASRFLLPEFVSAVTKGQIGSLALDLFAGVGLFSLPMARNFEQVIAVESNESAASDLTANVEAHALPNIRAIAGPAFDFLRRFARAGPDLVVLDPPRVGAGLNTLKSLVKLQPKCIHYVSCHPPTLARDLAQLVAEGYTLNAIEFFDFFPQTFHIECLAKLSQTKLISS